MNVQPGWTDQDLQKLEESITSFKIYMTKGLKMYQPFQFCTTKLHIIDNLVADLKRLGESSI